MPELLTPPAPPAVKPAPTPAAPPVSPPAAPAKPSLLGPKHEAKPKLGAKKALGLEKSVNKLMGEEIKKTRDRIRAQGKVTELPEPTAPAAPAPAPVTPPPTPAPVAAPAPDPAAVVPPPAAPPAAPAPGVPQTVKIGDKEYSLQELEAAVRRETPAPAAPAPAAPEPAPQPPTKEEIEAAEAKFIQDTAGQLAPTAMTEEQMDTMLAGGKDAVELLTNLRKQDMARSILEARKGIASALGPVMDNLFAAMRPIVAQHQDLQRYQIEQSFVTKHKDFAPHVATARSVAEELVRLYPQQVAKMNPEQFVDEVARQTDILLTTEHKRWFPQGNGNWRVAAAAPAPAPALAAAAPAPAPALAPAAAPALVAAPAPAAPVVAPTVRAPASNAPSGGGGVPTGDWRVGVAQSMRG